LKNRFAPTRQHRDAVARHLPGKQGENLNLVDWLLRARSLGPFGIAQCL
jgi:hypothetical protein